MARPVSKRKIGYFPENYRFNPEKKCFDKDNKVVITHVELEAVRLSDSEGLDQSVAAKNMDISRGTYQRILASARKKIADAIVFGKSLSIEGGNYYLKDCNAMCESCGFSWKNPCDVLFYENQGKCPECGSKKIVCSSKNSECCLGKRRHQQMMHEDTRQHFRK